MLDIPRCFSQSLRLDFVQEMITSFDSCTRPFINKQHRSLYNPSLWTKRELSSASCLNMSSFCIFSSTSWGWDLALDLHITRNKQCNKRTDLVNSHPEQIHAVSMLTIMNQQMCLPHDELRQTLQCSHLHHSLMYVSKDDNNIIYLEHQHDV
jgi:hypothetical protein